MTRKQKPGCLSFFSQLFGTKPKPQELATDQTPEPLPYRVRDDFLSPAELNFFRILQQAVGDVFLICPKVSLGDLFYPRTGQRQENQAYRNKINRKYIDFLLCDPQSVRPLLGIELDDSSHRQSRRQARDEFLERVFAAAELLLFRQPVRPAYNVHELATKLTEVAGMPSEKLELPKSTQLKFGQDPITPEQGDRPIEPATGCVPRCPRCQQAMVLRTVKKPSPRSGHQYWGCPNYPRCRNVRPVETVSPDQAAGRTSPGENSGTAEATTTAALS